MIVRGHCGDWSLNSCVVVEWTRQSSEWQHLLAVWYCVLEFALQRLSRVTASGSNGGRLGPILAFSCVAVQKHTVRKHVDRLALLEQKGHQIQSVTYHSLHSLSRTVCC